MLALTPGSRTRIYLAGVIFLLFGLAMFLTRSNLDAPPPVEEQPQPVAQPHRTVRKARRPRAKDHATMQTEIPLDTTEGESK
jgi:hypothetical protein